MAPAKIGDIVFSNNRLWRVDSVWDVYTVPLDVSHLGGNTFPFETPTVVTADGGKTFNGFRMDRRIEREEWEHLPKSYKRSEYTCTCLSDTNGNSPRGLYAKGQYTVYSEQATAVTPEYIEGLTAKKRAKFETYEAKMRAFAARL